MSLFGEFHIPADEFALNYTLDQLPEMEVEIERVVATDELLTPYFWVTGGDFDTFEAVTENDPSIRDLRRLDDFDRSTLFRADWTENIGTTTCYLKTAEGVRQHLYAPSTPLFIYKRSLK